jgi:hypothetical protein
LDYANRNRIAAHKKSGLWFWFVSAGSIIRIRLSHNAPPNQLGAGTTQRLPQDILPVAFMLRRDML